MLLTEPHIINRYYAEFLEAGGVLTNDDLLIIANANRPLLEKRTNNLSAYRKKNLKVHKRYSTTLQQSTNKIVNHFRKLIVDQKVDYLTGTAITYNYEGDSSGNEWLQYLLKLNHYDSLDAQTARDMAATGVAYRVMYLDDNADLRMLNLPPHEVIVLDNELGEVFLGIYAKQYINANRESVVCFEVYDEKFITYYERDVNGLKLIKQEAHGFNQCPVIKFTNPDEEADFECVNELIDAYDNIISMSIDEIDEYRLAYLTILSDVEVEEETLEKAKTHGCLYLNDPAAKVAYVTKNLNDAFYENAKNTIEKNIYKFSNTLDMSEESFTGASGEARKWKILALENKAQTAERMMIRGLRQVFKLIEDYLTRVKGVKFDGLNVDIIFNRNLPSEISQIVEENSKLSGLVSQRTLLARLPFIADVDKELEQLEAESDDLYLKAFNQLKEDPAADEDVVVNE